MIMKKNIKGKFNLDQDKIRIRHTKFNDILSFNKNIFYQFSHRLISACEL